MFEFSIFDAFYQSTMQQMLSTSKVKLNSKYRHEGNKNSSLKREAQSLLTQLVSLSELSVRSRLPSKTATSFDNSDNSFRTTANRFLVNTGTRLASTVCESITHQI